MNPGNTLNPNIHSYLLNKLKKAEKPSTFNTAVIIIGVMMSVVIVLVFLCMSSLSKVIRIALCVVALPTVLVIFWAGPGFTMWMMKRVSDSKIDSFQNRQFVWCIGTVTDIRKGEDDTFYTLDKSVTAQNMFINYDKVNVGEPAIIIRIGIFSYIASLVELVNKR